MKAIPWVHVFLLLSLAATALAACGGTDDDTAAASTGAAGVAGASGKGGATTAGAAGTSAGSAGASAGIGGATAAGSGGATAAGSGGATMGGTGGSSAGSAGAATAGASGATCASFDPPQMTSPTSVRLVNKGTSPIYLGETAPNCKFNLGFSVETASGTPQKVTTDACDFTCGTEQTSGCSCPPVACNPPIVTLLAPGATLSIGWPGTVFTSADMPVACYKEASCVTHGCFLETVAPKPSTLKASAWSEAKGCPGAGGCQDCTPGASGSCIVSGATAVAGTEKKGVATWSGEAAVVIEFP